VTLRLSERKFYEDTLTNRYRKIEEIISNYSLLIFGPPGSAKIAIALYYISSWLEDGKCVLLHDFSKSADDILTFLKEKFNPKSRVSKEFTKALEEKRLYIVDTFTKEPTESQFYGDPRVIFKPETDIKELKTVYNEVLEKTKKPTALVMDKLEGLIPFYPEKKIAGFVLEVLRLFKTKKCGVALSLNKGSFSQKFVSIVSPFFDNFIETFAKEKMGRVDCYFKIINSRFIEYLGAIIPFCFDKYNVYLGY